MNDYFSIRNQYCPNRFCDFYKKVLAENVVVHSCTTKRMRCKKCKKTWVAYRNEIQYGLRSDPKKIYAAAEMFKNGMSIRAVAARVAVSTSTVQRWKNRIKNHY